jgi:adenylosuccinate synthase
MRDYNSLPKSFKDYMLFIEHEIGNKINVISVGPDREQTIMR